MGGSESTLEDLEGNGIQLTKSYRLCCAHCCKPKLEEDKTTKWLTCSCCGKTYYCSKRCWHENADNHMEAHKIRGEVVMLVFEPNEKGRNVWHQASVNSVGLRGHNPKTGAVRISLGVSPVTVNVNHLKGTAMICVE
jgi:hypothetical protein